MTLYSITCLAQGLKGVPHLSGNSGMDEPIASALLRCCTLSANGSCSFKRIADVAQCIFLVLCVAGDQQFATVGQLRKRFPRPSTLGAVAVWYGLNAIGKSGPIPLARFHCLVQIVQRKLSSSAPVVAAPTKSVAVRRRLGKSRTQQLVRENRRLKQKLERMQLALCLA